MKRRPGFFIVNIVMPVVLLSALNIMVFLIPVDSGEKISYGITVLLALSVFLSIVADMLPRYVSYSVCSSVCLYVLLSALNIMDFPHPYGLRGDDKSRHHHNYTKQ